MMITQRSKTVNQSLDVPGVKNVPNHCLYPDAQSYIIILSLYKTAELRFRQPAVEKLFSVRKENRLSHLTGENKPNNQPTDKIQMDFVLKIIYPKALKGKELWVTLTQGIQQILCAQSIIDKMLKNDIFFLTYFWGYDSLFGWGQDCIYRECKRIS